MAFDGITIRALACEFKEKLINGRISKIAQPEKDELLITIKNEKETYKLYISVNPALPLIYIGNENKQSPITAPNFCMLLRKHIGNGKILDISQPGFERVIVFKIEHRNELGDLCTKKIYVELMGKHSNIIFCDEDIIIDSIKHVTPVMSSVRTVMPGQKYFIPKTVDKIDPEDATFAGFIEKAGTENISTLKAIYGSFTGISPQIANEVCEISGVDADISIGEYNDDIKLHIFNTFSGIIDKVKNENFSPVIYYKGDEPIEYCAFELDLYKNENKQSFNTMNELIYTYYRKKDLYTRIKQKSQNLRHVVNTALSKDRKKYDLQLKQYKDTEKMDKYRVYGELITSYSYQVSPAEGFFETIDFYTYKPIKIPLDKEMSAIENANHYFNKYNKLKRTRQALDDIIIKTKESIDYLENVLLAIEISANEEDLKAIRSELIEYGYIGRKGNDKKISIKSKPMHFISSDGFHMYVGKNNIQNEEVTFKIAGNSDWWFHAKNMPGSHVIVKAQGKELPDKTFEEAASLAAFYSKAKGQGMVEIDYIQRKHIKKVNGSKPGFVIYHTNFSMMAKADISDIEVVNDKNQ